jgi:hypothetical protein
MKFKIKVILLNMIKHNFEFMIGNDHGLSRLLKNKKIYQL